jgi:DNA polymerase-3 subunit beta
VTATSVFEALSGADTAPVTLDLTIKKFVLANLLDKTAPVIATRDVMPVLKNFQLTAQPDRLRVVASDLELTMIATTQLVTVTTPGVAVLPAQKMTQIVREARDDDVHLQVCKLAASVTIGPTTWHLQLQAGHDYPATPTVGDAVFATVERTAFVNALHAVRYAACKDAERASLMLIDIRAGKMTACDGARIQQAAFGALPFDCQLPIGAVDDLLKLLKLVDLPTISIGDTATKLIFRLGDDLFIVSKLATQAHDMESQLLRPALTNHRQLTVDRDELTRAVRRVRINADKETSAIALRLAPDRLTVAARDKFGNQSQETIDAGWAGPARTVVVNHAFLTDMLAGYSRPDCSFWLGDDTASRKTPMLLKDPQTGLVGALQQMHMDWTGQ